MHTTEIQARRLTAAQSTDSLVLAFLATEALTIDADVARARGWVMDELTTRGDMPLLAAALGLCPSCWALLDEHTDANLDICADLLADEVA